MSTKQTAVLLILFLGIFAAVLIFVPSEIPPPPPEVITAKEPEICTISFARSYGETWEQAQIHSGDEHYYTQIESWFENADDFREEMDAWYGKDNWPIYGVQFGWAVTFLARTGTSEEEIDRIYTMMNASMEKVGLENVAVTFKSRIPVTVVQPVIQVAPYNTVVKTYGTTWEEIWEREGKEYDYGRIWSWYYNNTGNYGEVTKGTKYYGDPLRNPINRIEYGWTITVWTDPISLTEMDQVYEKINRSMAKEGLWGIPVQFKYGEKFIADSQVYTVYITGHLTSGLTLTTEKDSIVRTRPQQNHLKSFLLILLTAAVAAVGFSRVLELPSDPESRPQKIAKFIEVHPGCSQKEITDATGYSRGSVLYNLKLLEQKKIVREAAYYGTIRYFSREANTSAMERMFHTILDQEKPARVLRAIVESPGISDTELAEKIGIAGTTLAWHLGRFADAGIVMRTKEGSVLTPEALEVWQNLFYSE
ncbi:winged helix-turn-helix transcriptional regulator [Methanorbis furvi]|uniref:HTH arsR-type domain-containing protein n=1 Tax=Methanorbis furvi TaxID=3028299 RepID=A0AAE4SB48_9EURY|nr:hypothetical protein [Methanocorpusculaceae archaeon Ag1]